MQKKLTMTNLVKSTAKLGATSSMRVNATMLKALVNMDEEEALAWMNLNFNVMPIGGKTRVVTWGEDMDFPGRDTIVMVSTLNDFVALYDKYRILIEVWVKDKKGGKATLEKKKVPVGTWWKNHPDRHQYDGGKRFMPQTDKKVVGNVMNLWRGFAVQARKPEGKTGADGCRLFLDHGLNIICSGNKQHYDYLIKREAFIAQRRIRSEIALALHTKEEGTGKGFWTRTRNRLYGTAAMQVQNPEHVIGKHNEHLETLLCLTADEALFALNPTHRNALYNMITEPDLTIEPKFIGAYKAKNHLNIDVISNSEHFIPVSGTARRFFAPTVSSERANDHKYFAKIINQMENGGYEALLYHLLYEVDISDFNIRNVPKTAKLAEQAAYSRKGIDLLVETACNEARAPCQPQHHPGYSVCTGYEKCEGFDYFVDHHVDRELSGLKVLKVKRRLTGKFEDGGWGCVTNIRRTIGSTQVHGMLWPSLKELRAKFIERHGPQEWLVETDEWLEDESPIM